MNSTAELKNLFEALAKSQAEMPTAGLNANNPFFKSKYANLPELVKASRPVLTKNGLSVIQGTHEQDGKIILFTRLCHISGEWIESVMSVLPSKPGIQEIGKEMSYLRRYQYACITGVVATDDPDDDDGESAMNAVRNGSLPYQSQKPASNANVVDYECISKDQLDELYNAIEQLPEVEHEPMVKKLRKKYDIDELRFLPKAQYRLIVDHVRDSVDKYKTLKK